VAQAIAARAVRYLPPLAARTAIRAYAGLRPWSPDHLPLIGPVDGVSGLYLATGHEGAGIGLAPVTGEVIARWLTDPAHGKSQTTSGPAWTVRPGRFGDLTENAAALRAAA
jgi:glycine/D-amino acid oxidase-like deaminating enzyme